MDVSIAAASAEQLVGLASVDRSSSDTLQSTVYFTLKASIMAGQLRAGQRFFEKDVAERLGVSRTPLREALRRLEAQGLVMFTEGRRGFEVVDPIGDVTIVYEIRQRLEGLAARLAAEHITVPQLEVLDGIQARMVKVLDRNEAKTHVEELAELNMKFHGEVNAACGEARLINLIDQLSPLYVSRKIVMLYSKEELKRSFSEHAEILAALWERDGERAEQLIHQHLKAGQKFMLTTASAAITPSKQ